MTRAAGEGSPGRVETWERLVRYHRVTTASMDDNLRTNCGHSLDEYDVLHQIADHGTAPRMGELAARLLVANSSCNRIVGRLVDSGHVRRLHGKNDGREVRVDLTAEGRRLRRRMAAVHTRDIERLFGAPLSPADHSALDAVMRHLMSEGNRSDTAV